MSPYHGYRNCSSIWRNRAPSMFGRFLMSRYNHPPLLTCIHISIHIRRRLTHPVNKQRPRHHPRNRQNNRLRRTSPEPPLAHPPHPRLLVLSLHPADHHPPPILLHGPRLLRSPRCTPLLPPPQPRGLQREPAGVDGSAGPWVSGRRTQSK